MALNQTNKAVTEEKLGYPIIEKMIETEDFGRLNESMSQCYDLLERQLKQKSGGLSKQKKVRLALKSYDLTIDLIRFLLKTKYEMLQASQKSEGVQKK